MRIEVENDRVRARKKQEYEDLVAEKEKEGFEAHLEKISVLGANVFGILVMLITAAITFPLFVVVNGSDVKRSGEVSISDLIRRISPLTAIAVKR